jgi:hypothetical protein
MQRDRAQKEWLGPMVGKTGGLKNRFEMNLKRLFGKKESQLTTNSQKDNAHPSGAGVVRVYNSGEA